MEWTDLFTPWGIAVIAVFVLGLLVALIVALARGKWQTTEGEISLLGLVKFKMKPKDGKTTPAPPSQSKQEQTATISGGADGEIDQETKTSANSKQKAEIEGQGTKGKISQKVK